MSAAQLLGVIFDMDGVLVDSHAAHRNAWRTFFQTLGRDVPEPELDFILDGRKRGDILRHFLRECPDAEIEELGRRKEDVAQGKPDPAVYRMASEGLALNHQSLLAVEDAISGVRAAVGAGLHCIGVALHETPENLRSAGAVQVVPNFESVSAKDLQEILRDCQLATLTP
jgi:beta-phosphoglucomutase-like phosphatase (HAD superfamily)